MGTRNLAFVDEEIRYLMVELHEEFRAVLLSHSGEIWHYSDFGLNFQYFHWYNSFKFIIFA